MFEPTLLFSLFSGLLGVTAAWHYGKIDLTIGLLAVVGVVLAQMAINLIDDYEDYSSGLDKDTPKTKFSGGSELVIGKLVKSNYVLAIGLVAFAIAISIGAYIIYQQPLLIPLVLVGAVTVLFYAKFLSKFPFLSEPLTGLNFALICIGCFIAAGGSIANAWLFIFAALAVGFQVAITVTVNYLPDRKADRKHGRKNIVAMLDDNRSTAMLYLIFEGASFLLVIYGVLVKAIPTPSLFVLFTVPIALAVACEISKYKNPKKFEKAMALAAVTELMFIILLIIAFL